MSKQSDLVSVSQGASGDPLYIDTANDRVGVGTSSPAGPLEVESSTNRLLTLDADSTADFTMLSLRRQGTEAWRFILEDAGDFSIREDANLSAEVMRVDTSGNLLVGKTSSDGTVSGCELRPGGRANFTATNDFPLQLRRYTSDGDIIQFRKEGTTVGSIGTRAAEDLYIGSGDTFAKFVRSVDAIVPANSDGSLRDNAIDLGAATGRYDDVYATNGTIQTSDRNEKQDIEALSDAEQRVAVAAKGLLRKYRWKDAVAEKGDAARIHFGIIAQDLQAAFEAEGLDAGRYGMFISNTWWEAEVEKTREVEQEDGTTVTETYTATETYDEPTEGAVERTRLGVRYPELLAFIIAAL